MGVYLCDSVVRVASLPSKTRLFRSILGSNFCGAGAKFMGIYVMSIDPLNILGPSILSFASFFLPNNG
jgi:hypothetical protein